MAKNKSKELVQNPAAGNLLDEPVTFDQGEDLAETIEGEPGGESFAGLVDDASVNDTPCNAMSAKAREKFETKRRLDAYLERQQLKELGWDEDDELFDDEFFAESDIGH